MGLGLHSHILACCGQPQAYHSDIVDGAKGGTMGVNNKKTGEGSIDSTASFAARLAAVRDADFNYLEPTSNLLGNNQNKKVTATNESSMGFATVTEEDLGHLAPGCFVQVGMGESSYWVEIGMIEGVSISGIVHPELSSSLCLIEHGSSEIVRFSRDQITALGCDRYCWC